jgi:hypothetical protein
VIEILVVRDPDGPNDVTVWLDGVDVTRDAYIVEVDAGAGWVFDEWMEAALTAAADAKSRAARDAIRAAFASPPGPEYIDMRRR